MPLGNHAFEQRKATILAILDDLGSPELSDSGRNARERRLSVVVDAPDPDLPTQARFKYVEIFRRDRDRWRLVGYTYDYVDLVNGGRFAYHRHDLPSRQDVLHVHCEPPTGASTAHFRAYEVTLLEAHDEFAGWWASGSQIECRGLRRLPDPDKEDR